MTRRLRTAVKRALLPSGPNPRKLRGGFPRGLVMDIDFAHHTQRWLGLQERELLPHLRQFSKGITSAVDVGAADGLYTLSFLARTPAHRVIAFEPDPACLSTLRRNLELNGLSQDERLQIREEFVGDIDAPGCTTLDAAASHLPGPILAKVDIDGGETRLLAGATRLLARPDVRWIIETHSQELEDATLLTLRQAGYHAKLRTNAWWRSVVPETRHCLNRWVVAVR